MAFVKHSQRTLRKGCKHCGNTSVYWGHDTAIAADHCGQCDVSGKWILLDADSLMPHILTCPAGKDAPEQTPDVTPDAAPKPVPAPEMPVEAPITAPAPVAPAMPTTDALAAFQALIGSMVPPAPTMDRAEIERVIREEFGKVVFPTRTVVQRPDGTVKPVEGKTHHMVAEVITDLLAGEHVMMVGPAGTGKSTIAEQAAEALGLEFGAISLSPQTPASQLLGYMNATGEYVRTLFRERYEHGGVFNFDEIDNGHPSVLAVMNAGLSNGQMAFPDGMVKRHSDFLCVASANTYGKGADRQYVGRQAIDAATLDRFTVETIGYDEALETDICHGTGAAPEDVAKVLEMVRRYRRVATEKKMAVVMGVRASVGMCRLIAAGKSWDAAMEARIRRGMSDADWSKLNG